MLHTATAEGDRMQATDAADTSTVSEDVEVSADWQIWTHRQYICCTMSRYLWEQLSGRVSFKSLKCTGVNWLHLAIQV